MITYISIMSDVEARLNLFTKVYKFSPRYVFISIDLFLIIKKHMIDNLGFTEAYGIPFRVKVKNCDLVPIYFFRDNFIECGGMSDFNSGTLGLKD